MEIGTALLQGAVTDERKECIVFFFFLFFLRGSRGRSGCALEMVE